MHDEADPALIALWARGWTLTRGAPPPEPVAGGWRIEANRPDHRWRFVYPRLCDDVVAQAHAGLGEPAQLKIVAPPERVRARLTFRWAIDVPAYVMTADPATATRRPALPDGYRATVETPGGGVTHVTITTAAGELAASGYLGVVDDLAVFDRIRTQEDHQRRGLGSAVMSTLAQHADAAGARRWALVATRAGRALYETLEWQALAPYTTVFIPAGS